MSRAPAAAGVERHIKNGNAQLKVGTWTFVGLIWLNLLSQQVVATVGHASHAMLWTKDIECAALMLTQTSIPIFNCFMIDGWWWSIDRTSYKTCPFAYPADMMMLSCFFLSAS